MRLPTRLRTAALLAAVTAGATMTTAAAAADDTDSAETASGAAPEGTTTTPAPVETTVAAPPETIVPTPSTTVADTDSPVETPAPAPAAAVAPVAVDDAATIWANHTASVDVLANDTVPAGSVVHLWNGSAAVDSITNSSGTWTVAGDRVVHTPPDGRAGPRTVRYVVVAPDGQQAIATVSVQVNSIYPPVILGNNASTRFGVSTTIDVLANDFGGSNRDGERYPLVPDTLRLVSPDGAFVTGFTDASGEWSVADGIVHYAPAEGFWGNVSVNYRVSDSVRQVGRGWISMAVLPTPDAVDDAVTGEYGATVTVPVTANDMTPPNTTFQLIGLVGANGNRTFTVVQEGIGTWTYSGFDVTFVPADGFTGTASVPYRLINSRNSSDDATVHVTIEPSVVTAVDDSAGITFKQIADVDVVANDSATGPQPDPTTLQLVAPDGSLVDGYVTSDGEWSVVDGRVQFDPLARTRGDVTATYSVGNGLTSGTGEVTVDVVTPGHARGDSTAV